MNEIEQLLREITKEHALSGIQPSRSRQSLTLAVSLQDLGYSLNTSLSTWAIFNWRCQD